MGLIVQKYGGSSLRDRPHLLHVADMIEQSYRAGNDIVVVLSAQGDTTDRLIAQARELDDTPSPRELDMLLSTGEQTSVALCAIELARRALPSVSLCGWQAGIRTDARYGDAKIAYVDRTRIARELEMKRIVLLAGFQGVDAGDNITTLGRGGSDTTAVAVAAQLEAAQCTIYTDVDGVYTTDPRLCPTAKRLDRISYEDMCLLAAHGAKVLHTRSAELAARSRVTLEVRSCAAQSSGTKIGRFATSSRYIGLCCQETDSAQRCRISLIGRGLTAQTLETMRDILKEQNIAEENTAYGKRCCSLHVAAEQAEYAIRVLHEHFFET